MEHYITLRFVVGSLVYSMIGLLVFVLSFIVLDKATPGNLWKEIIEEKNVAVAVLAGAVAIGISIIVAGAIQG